MKNIFSIPFTLVVFMILQGCNTTAPESPKETAVNPPVTEIPASEKMALQQIYNRLTGKLKSKIVLNDNELLIGDSSVKLNIAVDFNGERDQRFIYSANFSTKFRTTQVTEINMASVGVGASQQEATEVSVQEWFAVFGIPFTNMLKDTNALVIDGMKVFAGLMGIRGNLPENTWLNGSNEMNKKIISVIKNSIADKKTDLVPVDIKLLIGADGITDGECRICNEVSLKLLEELKKTDWPRPANPFMFKQFYLIKTGK